MPNQVFLRGGGCITKGCCAQKAAGEHAFFAGRDFRCALGARPCRQLARVRATDVRARFKVELPKGTSSRQGSNGRVDAEALRAVLETVAGIDRAWAAGDAKSGSSRGRDGHAARILWGLSGMGADGAGTEVRFSPVKCFVFRRQARRI